MRAGDVAAAVLGVTGMLLLAACSSGGAEGSSTGAGRTLDVLAASSLTEVFGELADRFEAEHPGTDVRLVLDSSTTLATQVAEGAPADVLATADTRSMSLAAEAGAVEDPQDFATNALVLVTPADDPGHVGSVEDLEDPDVHYLTCVESAPCGSVAAALLPAAGVTRPPSSLEVDVKAVLVKVTAGEADAGLVYATDALAAGDEVRTLPVPGAEQQPTRYQIASVEQSEDPALAGAWCDLVMSAQGQEALAAAGFGTPDRD